LESKTYVQSEVPLDFALSEPASAISYCLDNVSNVTIARNTTLTGLSAGAHSVAVYAWDIAGNVGVSQAIDFNVAEEQAPLQPEPFPATNVVAASGALMAAVVAVAALIYWKKQKQEAKSS
jgi:acetyl esterase/lipase